MSYLIQYDKSQIEDAILEPEHGLYYESERPALEREIETSPLKFSIYGFADEMIASGRFVGGEQDRAVPLEKARIRESNRPFMAKLKYDDGVEFTYNKELDCVERTR